ncbi:MAG: dihydrofolate reductase [Patescibacteria group bacterium]
MSTSKPINSIVACDMNNIIGHGIKMPGWKMTDDFLLNFVPKTKGCPVIMGRITAETLGKPLKGRTNIVVTRDLNFKLEGFEIARTFEEAVRLANEAPGEIIWIIGGGQIYELAFQEEVVSEVHITIITKSYPGENEIRFPKFKLSEYQIDPTRLEVFKKREPGTNGEKDKGNSDDAALLVYVRNIA